MINHRLHKFELKGSDEFLIWLNTTMLKLADVLIAPTTGNELRQQIIAGIFEKHSALICSHLTNKDEFVTRVAQQLKTNDPSQRICSLQIANLCPTLISQRLDVQH